VPHTYTYTEYNMNPRIVIARALLRIHLHSQIASVLLIANTSALTLTLAGLFKDVLLVIFSVLFYLSPLTAMQVVGYAMSLSGMNIYKDFKKDPAAFTESIKNRLSCCFSSSKKGLASDSSNTTSLKDDTKERFLPTSQA
jgi:hypothetical protein